MKLADATHCDAAAPVRDAASHSLEKLEESRVTLVAGADTGVDAVDRDRAAEHRRGCGGIRGRGDVAGNAQVSRSNLPLLDPDQIPITLDLHAAPSQRSDREIDERRRHERAQDFEAEAAVEPWRDEQQR